MSKELKASVQALSEKIIQSIEVDKAGVGKATSNTFDDNLPESITPEHVKTLKEYEALYVPAAVDAFGKVAIAAMGEHNINTAQIEMPMAHKDTLSIGVTGQTTVDDKTTYGELDIVMTSYAASNGAQLKIARNLVTEAAQAAFASVNS